MGLIAFAAPLILGMTAYGNYVIETTIVLVAAGILEVMVVVALNESNTSERRVPVGSILFLLAFGLIFLGFIFEFFFRNLVPVFLFLTLFFRTSVTVINTRARLITLPVMVLCELLFSITFVICLVGFISSDQKGSETLIWANAVSQLIAGTPLLKLALKELTFEVSFDLNIRAALPLLLSRLPEDVFYLLIPFLAGMKAGPESAASLRIVGSATKAIAKLTPVRFDTLAFYLRAQRNLEYSGVKTGHIFTAIVFGLVLLLIVEQGLLTFYSIERDSSVLIFSAPFVVLVTILSPVLMMHKAFAVISINLLMLLTLLIFSFFQYELLIFAIIVMYAMGAVVFCNLLHRNIALFTET